MSLNTDGLAIVQQIRSDIAPGVSGWKGSDDEAFATRALIKSAMETLEIDTESTHGVRVNNLVYENWTLRLPPSESRPKSEGAREAAATPGLVLVAFKRAEQHFQHHVNEELGLV